MRGKEVQSNSQLSVAFYGLRRRQEDDEYRHHEDVSHRPLANVVDEVGRDSGDRMAWAEQRKRAQRQFDDG